MLIIFGVGKLPDIGSGMGKAIKNFKKATDDAQIDVTPGKDKIGDSAKSNKNKSKNHA